jgi:hypothetical protein
VHVSAALSCQVAAVLVVADPELRAVMQQELPVICLLAKLEPSKVITIKHTCKCRKLLRLKL